MIVNETLNQMTSYKGSKFERLELRETQLNLRIQNFKHRFEAAGKEGEGASLHACYGEHMIERVV